MKKTSREVLFDSPFIRVVKLDGWFYSTEPAQSKGNLAVAVLPYRKTGHGKEFLSRFELNPAHMTDHQHQVSIITGACETGDPLYHAKHELLEEAGYDIPEQRFNHHGFVCPAKASSMKLHLYSVRILAKDKRKEYHGDGSRNESKEFAEWVDREMMVYAKDPYIHTIMMRGKL